MRKRKEKQELIWCWYCDKEFQDERTLVQHQRLRHFKCSECPRKLLSGPGLRQHMMQVHKQSLEKIPNSLVHRESVSISISGMDGIPEKDLNDKELAQMKDGIIEHKTRVGNPQYEMSVKVSETSQMPLMFDPSMFMQMQPWF